MNIGINLLLWTLPAAEERFTDPNMIEAHIIVWIAVVGGTTIFALHMIEQIIRAVGITLRAVRIRHKSPKRKS